MKDIEFPGPILVFDIKRLEEACDEIYKYDYYPLFIIRDENHEMMQKFRKDFPDENVDCIIIPVRYLTKFLA